MKPKRRGRPKKKTAKRRLSAPATRLNVVAIAISKMLSKRLPSKLGIALLGY